MYFWEFFETCTIGWVLICEGGVGVGKRNTENAFFLEKFYRGHDLPHPRRSLYTPPVETPAPAHSDGLHITGSSVGRARCKADHATHRHTRPDAGHAAPVCTRYQTDHAGAIGQCAGRWRAGNSSIMRIVIALSQAWYIDSNMNKYHKDILLFLVIANCYLYIDI